MVFGIKKKNDINKEEADLKPEFLNNLDSDSDGLTDYEEIYVYGTDPNNKDTDKDGVSDFQEVKMGQNPLGSGKLKSLFIPCKNNDYKPRILNPYRLIFYSVSAIIIKSVIVLFVLLFPISAWLTPDVLSQESKKIIELTNEIRRKLSVNTLSEQQLLNQAAYDKAQDMLVRQYFAHVGPDNKDLSTWLNKNEYKYSVAGENLAIGFASAEDVVIAWTKSKTHYSNLVDGDFKEIGVGMVSGPFNGHETTLVAQYFASGNKSNTVASPIIQPVKPVPIKETQTEIKPVLENQNVSVSTSSQDIIIPEIPVGQTETPPLDNQKETEDGQVVLNEKIDKPNVDIIEPKLEPPVLISPQNGSIINQREVKLVVRAISAEEVLVYDSGIEIGKRSSISSEFFDFYFTFKNGTHKLNFKSVANGSERISEDYLITISANDLDKMKDNSKLVVLQPKGQQEQIVKAAVYLDKDITEAWVDFSGHRIDLEKTNQSGDYDQWEGQLIIFDSDKKNIFDVITLPVLNTETDLGKTDIRDISWENVTPVNPSLLKQYFFIKSNPLKDIDLIFNFESLFYKIILFVAVISLILNIFVEIKKQYPNVIFSTLGFITLLVVLIII